MKKLAALLAGAMLMMATVSAQALTIGYNDFANGTSTASGTGWNATASRFNAGIVSEAQFQKKNVNGQWGVGIAGGTAGEIDINEFLTISFAQKEIISSFTISALFAKGTLPVGPFGDPNEVANTILSTMQLGFLTATGPQSAVWSTMPGSLSANASVVFKGIDATKESDTAMWTVYNPFGNQKIDGIAFTASKAAFNGGNDSDYCFVDLSTVPEPGTMVLLGFGMLGLAIYGKRRMNKEA